MGKFYIDNMGEAQYVPSKKEKIAEAKAFKEKNKRNSEWWNSLSDDEKEIRSFLRKNYWMAQVWMREAIAPFVIMKLDVKQLPKSDVQWKLVIENKNEFISFCKERIKSDGGITKK